jgi:Cu/Ag efflux pump CusA
MEGIPGVADLQVEQQVLIPQLHISVNREAAARVGFTPATLTDAMETATKGKVVGQVLDGLKVFDITLTLDDHHRTDPTAQDSCGWCLRRARSCSCRMSLRSSRDSG